MRVTREQATANRERIIEAAGELFRSKGFSGIGVADIMKAADLTHGGFYSHFVSKDDLIAQASDARWQAPPQTGGKLSLAGRSLRSVASITCRCAIAMIPATAAPSRRRRRTLPNGQVSRESECR